MFANSIQSALWRAGLFVLVFLLAFSSHAVGRADIISFDPDGTAIPNGSSSVVTFDLLPGNALFENLGSIITPKTGQAITHYMQTRLGSLLDANGHSVDVTGLNSNFEITLAAGFSASATTALVPNTTSYGTSYSLAESPGVHFFNLYYDDNPLTKANDLTGTGFDDGHLILSGTITAASGSFAQSGSTNPPLPDLDSFGANNYPGVTSYRVAGGESLSIHVDSYDPAFFTLGTSVLDVELLNQSDITPFRQANPSSAFLPNLANILPSLGAVNGANADFQTQTDANSSFTIDTSRTPEPSSCVLMGVGFVAFVGSMLRGRDRTIEV